MERKYEIDVKTRRGSYKTYKITFNGERHYENWCNAMERKYGHKIIGERPENGVGYGDIDDTVAGYISDYENHKLDQTWNRIK